MPDVATLSQEVLDDLTPREREVQDTDGRSYSLWVRPYRTAENQIDGVCWRCSISPSATSRPKRATAACFESAADGIVIIDAASGEILDVNPFLLRLSGYPRDRIVSAKIWESPLFQGSGIDEKMIRQLGETESLHRNASLVAESGSSIETEIVCNLYSEGVLAVQLNIRDITARKHVESQFQAQEQQVRREQQLESAGGLPAAWRTTSATS